MPETATLRKPKPPRQMQSYSTRNMPIDLLDQLRVWQIQSREAKSLEGAVVMAIEAGLPVLKQKLREKKAKTA